MEAKTAEKINPVPVGAETNTCLPDAMGIQASC